MYRSLMTFDYDAPLIAVDAGNGNTKFIDHMGVPGHFRSAVAIAARQGVQEETESVREQAPLFTYQAGPAATIIPPETKYLVGLDAEQHGLGNLNTIGETQQRMDTSAYIILTLMGIVSSLPPGVMTTTIDAVIGVPVEDHKEETKVHLQERLKGREEPEPHVFLYGDDTYTLTIKRLLVVAQPHGTIATLRFTPEAQLISDKRPQILACDLGVGTVDVSGRGGTRPGRGGMEALPGTEFSLPYGATTVAQYVVRSLAERLQRPERTITTEAVLRMIHDGVEDATRQHSTEPRYYMVNRTGESTDVTDLIHNAARQVAERIWSELMASPWKDYVDQSTIALTGGNVMLFGKALAHFGRAYAIHTLEPDPTDTWYGDMHPMYRNVLGFRILGLLLRAKAVVSHGR